MARTLVDRFRRQILGDRARNPRFDVENKPNDTELAISTADQQLIAADDLYEPFDIAITKLFCSACGRECVPLGHMFSRFLLCPDHGEFTIAPVVIEEPAEIIDWDNNVSLPNPRAGQWRIHFKDSQERGMWQTAQHVIKERLTGGQTRVAGYVPDGVEPHG